MKRQKYGHGEENKTMCAISQLWGSLFFYWLSFIYISIGGSLVRMLTMFISIFFKKKLIRVFIFILKSYVLLEGRLAYKTKKGNYKNTWHKWRDVPASRSLQSEKDTRSWTTRNQTCCRHGGLHGEWNIGLNRCLSSFFFFFIVTRSLKDVTNHDAVDGEVRVCCPPKAACRAARHRLSSLCLNLAFGSTSLVKYWP